MDSSEIKIRDILPERNLDMPHQQLRLDKLLQLVDDLNLENRAKLLDVGCAGGYVISKIREKHPTLWCFGLDLNREYLKKAIFERKIFCVRSKAEAIPFEDEYFSVVIFADVVEHLKFPLKALYEINRVLKSGGHLIMTFPNHDRLRWRLLRLFGNKEGWERNQNYTKHKQRFNLTKVKDLLDLSGFQVKKVRGNCVDWFPITKNLEGLPYPRYASSLLGDLFPTFAGNIILLASKVKNSLDINRKANFKLP